MSLKTLLDQTQQLREDLCKHSVYTSFNSLSDVKHFMEYHVFAVWDFMSLVKSLQNHFCGTQMPWTPPKNANIARFINEIVLAEESDVMPSGQPISHFEMYLMAMEEVGADTTPILAFLEEIALQNKPMQEVIDALELDEGVKDFLISTFSVIESGKMHCVAASFAFGREDIIPEMFMKVVGGLVKTDRIPAFKYYLERHIELDGDEHGPMALEMMNAICGNDAKKWHEATQAVKEALQARINLWTRIELLNPTLLPNAFK
ncbi:DUF3050 domain-containing protein [Flavobacteriales bacterium]|nr:DUF3050 domain-containing protein [Flavobacteriales bacterium]